MKVCVIVLARVAAVERVVVNLGVSARLQTLIGGLGTLSWEPGTLN